jgi:hypothetical protein
MTASRTEVTSPEHKIRELTEELSHVGQLQQLQSSGADVQCRSELPSAKFCGELGVLDLAAANLPDGGYSKRNATIGSSRAARRAG